MTVYLAFSQLLRLHELQTRRFGGSRGLRDAGALDAAAARPRMTFGGEDLYPDLAAKAAALMHSVVVRHPFVDANKRVGAMAAELFLGINGCDLEVADDAFEEAALAVARGEIEAEALAVWFRQRLRLRER